jgi:hypothetical protein
MLTEARPRPKCSGCRGEPSGHTVKTFGGTVLWRLPRRRALRQRALRFGFRFLVIVRGGTRACTGKGCSTQGKRSSYGRDAICPVVRHAASASSVPLHRFFSSISYSGCFQALSFAAVTAYHLCARTGIQARTMAGDKAAREALVRNARDSAANE